jgi:hypothetical protein
MDDWSASATAQAAASGQASNLPQSVTLTQARFFMDDGTWPDGEGGAENEGTTKAPSEEAVAQSF